MMIEANESYSSIEAMAADFRVTCADIAHEATGMKCAMSLDGKPYYGSGERLAILCGLARKGLVSLVERLCPTRKPQEAVTDA